MKKYLFIILLLLSNAHYAQNSVWGNIFSKVDVKAYSIFIDKSDNIYLGCTKGLVFSSSDHGNSWEKVGASIDSNTTILSLIKLKSNKLYVSADHNLYTTNNVYSYENIGQDWVNITQDLPMSDGFHSKRFFLDGNETIWFSGSFIYDPHPSTYYSIDDGISWSEIKNDKYSLYINDVDIVPSGVIYIAGIKNFYDSYATLMISTNSGVSWVESIYDYIISSQGMRENILSIDISEDNYSFLCTKNHGVYRSNDRTINSWTAQNNGLNSLNTKSIVRIGNNKLYVTTDEGIYVSDDFSENWTRFDEGITNKNISVIVKNSENSLFCISGDGCLYKTNNPITSINIDKNRTPTNSIVSQNYPNPFNSETTINFELSKPSSVSIDIYNYLGEKIEILISENYNAGCYFIKWNAALYSSGVYFYKIRVDEIIHIKKMLYLK